MSTDDDAVLLARETRAIEHERERMGLRSSAPGRGNGATRLGRRWDGKGRTGIAGDPPPLRFKSASAFCAEYVPLAYIIEGLLRSSSLYALTAKTGAGKTAFNIIVALAVATGPTRHPRHRSYARAGRLFRVRKPRRRQNATAHRRVPMGS
jgi:AAA domain